MENKYREIKNWPFVEARKILDGLVIIHLKKAMCFLRRVTDLQVFPIGDQKWYKDLASLTMLGHTPGILTKIIG